MNAAGPAIRIEGLHKRFGRQSVLRGLDLEIPGGSVTALVGPNAAGKTTLVKCLLGLVRPDAGRIELDGHPVGVDPSYRERIGYMPQHPSFPDNLRVGEWFSFIDGLRGVSRPAGGQVGGQADRFDRLPDESPVDEFDLAASWDKQFRVLSGGTRQKVNAAVALRYEGDLLVLDEPTAGLDPLARTRLKELLRVKRDGGATVLVTSHVLSELRDLADHLVYVVDGRLRYAGDTTDLLRQTDAEDLESAVARLMSIEGIDGLEGADGPGSARAS